MNKRADAWLFRKDLEVQFGMSALGHKRAYAVQEPMSALPRIATAKANFRAQPTAVTSAKPMPAAKFADRVAWGALMIALPARHRRQ